MPSMTSAAVATGSPLWSLAVWEEDREEEGVLPTIWIQGNSVRWPRGKNTEKKMAEMCAPDGNWDTFPLVKVKCQSDSKKECEEYNFTTTVESAGEDSSEETRKRKHTKKVWGDDFVTDIDGIRRRKGQNEEEDYNLPPELPIQSGDEQEGDKSKEQDGSQVKKPTEKRKLPSPPIKIHNGKQYKSGRKEDKSGWKENQSARKKNPNGRVENRGQAKTGVNKTARQLIQEFEERRSRDKRKQIISESDSPSSDDDEDIRRRHKKARHSEKRERSRYRKRSPSKKRDLFPMDEGRFQRKVLYILTGIRDSVKSAGKVTVEQCRGLQIQQLSTLDELKEFEQFLEEGDNLEKLKFTFNRIGGNSAAEHIKRIMEKTMTNGLQSLMNRTGKNKKFPFESTYIYSTLEDVVLKQWREKITVSKLEDKVQAILKFAPYRIGGDKLSGESRKRAEKQNETNSHLNGDVQAHLQESDSDQAHLQESDSDQ